MKNCLLFSFIFFVKIAFSQVYDNFEDGDFSNSPQWTGSNGATDFAIFNNQLRSNSSTANSNFYLSTANLLASSCIWEFYANLQFATSGANYVDVYLISDQANLHTSNINGYFVRIGHTSDEISLYKRSGSTISKLIDGADASVSSTSNNRIKIKVTRTSDMKFNLERDLTGVGTSYITEGEVTDASFTSSAYFGILIQQSTSSFFQKHFFDNFNVRPIVVDQTPPKLLAAIVINENQIEVEFDEPVEELSALNALNYDLDNNLGNPVKVEAHTVPRRYILTFARNFESASYRLQTHNISDKNGNIISSGNTIAFNYIKPYLAKKGDIVINEIFADPSPRIDLPGFEFIELWNTSSETFSLKNWKYSDATSTAILPDYLLKPNEYLILCARADTTELKQYGNVLGLSPWPSLNNTSETLKLINSQGALIDSVSYSNNWYKNVEKKAGGWTLELIDPKAVCSGTQNWTASTDPNGGTPGKQNSAYRSLSSSSPLTLTQAFLKDSLTIKLVFNRQVDSLSAANVSYYSVNNGLGSPAIAKITSPNFTEIEIQFNTSISRGKNYRITASNLSDCTGILISSTNNSAEFFYPEKIKPGGILISEILFNPRKDGVDFVEIYNSSDSAFDLQELAIATIKADTLSSIKSVSASQYLFSPKQYLVLTTDPSNIKKEYHTENPEAFLKMTSMPSFNDDAGTVVLLSGESRIDQFSYTDKMHFGLIKDAEGVSLERINFMRPASEPGNFRSAAASVGFASPGYKNSQGIEDSPKAEEVSLVSQTFSPDNDGFEDNLIINYKFPEGGIVANASIYNDKGILIRKLVKNSTLPSEGSFHWDGLDERSSRVPVGIYIVYMDISDTSGKLKKFRKSCVLATKLN